MVKILKNLNCFVFDKKNSLACSQPLVKSFKMCKHKLGMWSNPLMVRNKTNDAECLT